MSEDLMPPASENLADTPAVAPTPVPQPKERVLVVPASSLPADLFAHSPLMSAPDAVAHCLNTVLAGNELAYMDRDEAETNESFLQIIPYTVILCGPMVFAYRRSTRGGEKRLHQRWSLGVGGHINPVDGEGLAAYEKAFWRELGEEVSVTMSDKDSAAVPVPVGLILDGSDAVGRVHLGVVHLFALPPGARLEFKDPALADGQFRHRTELRNLRGDFENWSRFVIDRFFS